MKASCDFCPSSDHPSRSWYLAMSMKRVFLTISLIAMHAGAWSQAHDVASKPQVTITIREHPTTADLVEVTMLDAGYPRDLLKRQCEAIGENAGSPVRGLYIGAQTIGGDPKLRFLKASFATDNLIDRANSVLRLEPIVRAFAGAPAPYTVQGMSVSFVGEKPNRATVGKFSFPEVVSVVGTTANSSFGPQGIEYRVTLLSQDPARIHIPEQVSKVTDRAIPAPKQKASWFGPVVVITAGSLITGLLVYFAILRPSRPLRPSNPISRRKF